MPLELDKRSAPHLKQTNDSWRVETYIKVKGQWKFDRAVDSQGKTLDFLLSGRNSDAVAAERLRKTLKAAHTQTPRVMDKNAAYPPATETQSRNCRNHRTKAGEVFEQQSGSRTTDLSSD